VTTRNLEFDARVEGGTVADGKALHDPARQQSKATQPSRFMAKSVSRR